MLYLWGWDRVLQEAIFNHIVPRIIPDEVLEGQELPVTDVVVTTDGVNAEVVHVAILGHVGENVRPWSSLTLPDQVAVRGSSTLESRDCLLPANAPVKPPAQKGTHTLLTIATSANVVHG